MPTPSQISTLENLEVFFHIRFLKNSLEKVGRTSYRRYLRKPFQVKKKVDPRDKSKKLPR